MARPSPNGQFVRGTDTIHSNSERAPYYGAFSFPRMIFIDGPTPAMSLAGAFFSGHRNLFMTV
jgi:hypothetical protein